MISLRLKTTCDPTLEPFVVRLVEGKSQCEEDALLFAQEPGKLGYRSGRTEFWIQGVTAEEIAGDVLLVDPGRQVAHRLIRSSSPHNTLLVTEQCDQLCVMCSQPPKLGHTDMFDYFFTATMLAPPGMQIGLSGGEPLLHKDALFAFIEKVSTSREDIKFHILTNGQHFKREDLSWLRRHRHRLLWGVPIYSADSRNHDVIVGKSGAFEKLCYGFAVLGLAGAALELRTVMLRHNAHELPCIADFVSRHLSFATTWAIMQLERIGLGRMNWRECFFDSSVDFSNIGEAVDLMRARNQNVVLYNFPLCTVPPAYQNIAVKSISDWKQKFLPCCDKCSLRNQCAGFFEWYREEDGYKGIRPQ